MNNYLNVYEITHLDYEQMSHSEMKRFGRDLLITFSEEKIIKTQTFWDKLLKSDSPYVYKFYRYHQKSYLGSDHPAIAKSKLTLNSETGDFELLSLNKLDSDITLARDYFKFNGRYFRLISLLEMPSEISPSELDQLGDYGVFFKSIPKEKSQGRVKRSRNIHYSSLISTGPRDVEGELSHQENEKMLCDLITGDQSMFRVEVFFIVNTDTEEELKLKTSELLKELKMRGAKPFIESHSLYSLIKSLFAIYRPKFSRAMDKNSEYLFHLLPLQNDYLMDRGIAFKSITQRDVYFDLFHPHSTNFNALISGESGSGKSMLVQKIVKEEFDKGTSVLVLDLGHSFKKLSCYYEAKVFSGSFNPMAFRDPHYLKEFCLSFVDRGELTKKEEGTLFKVIQETLLSKDKLSFNELISEIDNRLSGFSLYFEEYQAFFHDNEMTTAREQEFIYVDTTIYPDKVKQGLILYLFEFFKNFSSNEKILVIDEAWDILKDNAEYIEECFRTFRKFKASAVAISQSISDFCDNGLGRAIYNNSYYKCIFRQNTSDSSVFDDEDKKRIGKLKSIQNQYSQFYLKTSDHRKILSYKPTELEYELFTSSRDDNYKIQKFLELNSPYFNFKDAFNRWVDFKSLRGGLI